MDDLQPRPAPGLSGGEKFRVAQRLAAVAVGLIAVCGLAAAAFLLGTRSSGSAPRATSSNASTQELQAQIDVLQGRLETTTSLQEVLLVAVTVILTLGGLTSVVGWFRSESRTQDDSVLRGQVTDLAITGARSQQTRDVQVHDTFMEASKRNLELVNLILERAAHASSRVTDSASQFEQELADEGQHLLDTLADRHDHDLITDAHLRAHVCNLGNRIDTFTHFGILMPEAVTLSPVCRFFHGVHLYLEDQFNPALDAWRYVTKHPGVDQKLRSRALYWLGHEHRNLGDFRSARRDLKDASQCADEGRRRELNRLLLETKLFDKAAFQAADLIKDGQKLVKSFDRKNLEAEDIVEAHRAMCTLGNILFCAATDRWTATDAPTRARFLDEAVRTFREADQEHDPWADFGLAETYHALGRFDEARPLFAGPVREAAHEECFNRDEARPRARARAIELICAVRLQETPENIKAAYHHALETLRSVDDRLLVYSPVQRRNVSKDEFRRDLESLASSGDQRP